MLDIAFIRNNPEVVKEGVRKKRMKVDIDEILSIDNDIRFLKTEVETLRADRNRISKDVSRADGPQRDELISQIRFIKESLTDKEPKLKNLEERFEQLMLFVPNPPAPEVPEGDSDEDNVVLREVGKPPTFDFTPKDH
ncbi:MAG: seryl-tRNA synthetase, partial [Thermodesulfobacteriota bacterium]|nr:seryl-tRNA synthetase [Thermodesulfobacteriota bacterium]